MKLIRDEKGTLIGQVIENGNMTYLRDGTGKLQGQHNKAADKTYDGQGRLKGNGDQLLRLLKK